MGDCMFGGDLQRLAILGRWPRRDGPVWPRAMPQLTCASAKVGNEADRVSCSIRWPRRAGLRGDRALGQGVVNPAVLGGKGQRLAMLFNSFERMPLPLEPLCRDRTNVSESSGLISRDLVNQALASSSRPWSDSVLPRLAIARAFSGCIARTSIHMVSLLW